MATRVSTHLRPGRAGLAPVAKAGELSPHTTTGTLNAPIKPEVLMEAGNACPDGTIANSGIEELSVLTTSARHASGRVLESDHGTSVATAAPAGLAADVSAENPGRRPETIRALIVNSARWPVALKSQLPARTERIRCAGYGVPSREAALASTLQRATLIHEGRMARIRTTASSTRSTCCAFPSPTTSSLRSGPQQRP